MQNKELVIREEKAYFRRSPDRSLETILAKEILSDADYNRLRVLLYFGEGAYRAYGKSYEEVIKSVRDSMKLLPLPKPRFREIYIISKSDLEQIKLDLAVKGKIGRWHIPDSQLVLLDGKKRLREIVI